MPTRPSIKGSILANHAEVLQKYLASAQLDPKVLANRFEPGDLELLAGPIDSAHWYDIQLYQRLMEFLRDHPGHGDNQYLIDAGRRSAENLIRAGIHQQLEYLRRTQHAERSDAHERFVAFGRDLRLLTTVTATILNFTQVQVKADPEHQDRWMIEYTEAEHYPEVLCWTNQGFINRMAEEHGSPDLWYWERPDRDRVRCRMNRAV
jgi:hypothetical protein